MAALRDAVGKRTATLEWAIQRGGLAKLWVSGSMKAPNDNNPVHPDDLPIVNKAIELSFSSGHATVRVEIKEGRVDDIIYTQKANLGSDLMREPRRPR